MMNDPAARGAPPDPSSAVPPGNAMADGDEHSHYERITHELADGIARIALDRPEKRNALDALTVQELSMALAFADVDDATRVVVLTGNGPDFCAGADLSQLESIAAGAGPLENLADASDLGDLLIQMRRMQKPIIAAVRGSAIAGGAGLATACDMILASRGAVFGYPEVHLGFVPAMVMALLRRTVGEKVAFELVVRGGRIDAAEAQRLGIVNRVVEEDDFDEAVHHLAAEVAARSPSAVRLIKRLFYGMDGMGFEEAIARGAEVNVLARMTPDCQDGVRRFLAKQKGVGHATGT